MGQKLRLVGCERYNFRGELYLKGKVYLVGDNKATLMLRAEDDFGRPYFAVYVQPKQSKTDRIAQAAAAAAAAAALATEDDEVIERTDNDEPEVDETDPDASVEVDTDDDPDLDEEAEDSSEAVDDEDRDDGTAVKV